MNNEQTGKNSSSRRHFAFGAAVAAAAAGGARAYAQQAPMESSGDIAVLNFALTLEHLEAYYYTDGLNKFKASDFSTATFAKVLGSGTASGVYTNLQRVRDHENAHVEALTSTIKSMGGTPVEPCIYKFSYETADEFLQVAQMLEEVGVTAYDGALALLSAEKLKAAGASIATVEARHASYLALVNSAIPFPKAFDDTKTMKEVLEAAKPFLASCASTPVGMTTTAVLMPKNLTTVNRQVTLDASQSISGDAGPLTYSLRVVSGSAAVTRIETANPIVQFSSGQGYYVFELTVMDGSGNKSTDRISIWYAGS